MEQQITRRRALVTLTAGIAAAPFVARAAEGAAIPDGTLVLVVADPLAAPLSCACIQGYAQRNYDKLGTYLQGKVGRPVKVVFAETLTAALEKTGGRADLVVGKESAVLAAARAGKLGVTKVASLTGKDGATTQTGLVVVPADDPALMADALKDYRIFFGPADADESHAAALDLLKDLEVPVPAAPETCPACSVGAARVLALHRQGVKAAAVISSYAQPLLEGCGTIQKGALRVVGKTDPVPFVAAFATDRLSAGDRATVTAALLGVGAQPELCAALETKSGFVDAPADAPKKK
jgi:ABC-type phosphate/phosphonate transport system substrate-binding protein